MPLYDIKSDPMQGALGAMKSASTTTAAMEKKQFTPPKTAGGAMMSGLGAGMAGLGVASLASEAGVIAAASAGPIGWAALGVGILAYYMS